ncbi:DUF1127 domain-containing protein [Bradyrhizobium sp.]|uniref:DUF1127 domain-containing protein n=1 Tax=Bradyrhizobium sp. TaxID=376 RepID=UPI003C77B4BC
MSQTHPMREPWRAGFRAAAGRNLLSACDHIIAIWLDRRQGRQELVSLDDRQLKDVGISREEALREAGKPFWRR